MKQCRNCDHEHSNGTIASLLYDATLHGRIPDAWKFSREDQVLTVNHCPACPKYTRKLVIEITDDDFKNINQRGALYAMGEAYTTYTNRSFINIYWESLSS